jgi:hypothetical protein
MFRSACIAAATVLLLATASHALVRLGRRHAAPRPLWTGEVTPYLGFVDISPGTRARLGLDDATAGVFGLSLGFYATPFLEFAFSLSDIPTSTVLERTGSFPPAPGIGHFVGADIVQTDFSLLYNFSPPGAHAVPYLEAGIGRESVFYDGDFSAGYTTWQLGAGIRARLHHRVAFHAAFRHDRTFVEEEMYLNQIRLGLSILF